MTEQDRDSFGDELTKKTPEEVVGEEMSSEDETGAGLAGKPVGAQHDADDTPGGAGTYREDPQES